MQLSLYIEELKKLVLSKYGIKIIQASDCKALSVEITKASNKYVSETTIKRLYGFAQVKHNFSKFTLTALCQYIGKDSWEDFYASLNQNDVKLSTTNWADLKQRADKITAFTLKTIKNRSGIPYALTADRKFAEQDFHFFLKSDFGFTCFVSPPGHGKSVLICRLTDKFFYNKNSEFYDSMVWLINTNVLNNVNTIDFQLDTWLEELLSAGEQLSSNTGQPEVSQQQRVILILDGFDELLSDKDRVDRLFSKITDFICANENYRQIKMVLSMRSTTWLNFYDRIRSSAYLRSQWFPGNYFNQADLSNVPPLTDSEITAVLTNFDTGFNDLKNINPKLKEQFRFPFYLQLYYQLKQEGRIFDSQKDLTFYELIGDFIHTKIYTTRYSTEKVLLLKKIIELTGFGHKGHTVYKEKLIDEINLFRDAYEDLLQSGILVQENQSDLVNHHEIIRFSYTPVFEYFLFIELMEKFNGKISAGFLQSVSKEYEPGNVRIRMLQWTIRYALISKEFDILAKIIRLPLPYSEKYYLILSISDILQYKSVHRQYIFNELNSDDLHDAIIAEFVQFDFADPFYKDAVYSVSGLTGNKKSKFIYQVILSIIAFLELDKTKLKEGLDQAKILNSNEWQWLINPVECLEFLHLKLSDEHPENAAPPSVFTQFVKEPHSVEHLSGNSFAEDSICCFLIMSVNLLAGTQQGITDIISSFKKFYPGLFLKRKSGFNMIALNLTGIALARTGKTEKSVKVLNLLTKLRQSSDIRGITRYSSGLTLLLQAELCRKRGKYLAATEFALKGIKLFRSDKLILNQISLFLIIIDCYTLLKEQGKANLYLAKLKNLLEEKNIPVGQITSGTLQASFKPYETSIYNHK